MFNGRRQPSSGGTSRMMREYQVRICERLGVKFPGSTRPSDLGYRGQAVAALAGASDEFVVVWNTVGSSPDDTSGYGIRAAIFNSAGNLVKADFAVNTTVALDQETPSVVGLLDGGFAVAWRDTLFNGTVVRTFDALGNPTSGEHYLDFGRQDFAPQLTLLADGRIAVTWEEDQTVPQDTDGSHTEMQIVDMRTAAVNLTAFPTGSDLVGTPFDDTLHSSGNDRFDGGAGFDTVHFAGTRASHSLARVGATLRVTGGIIFGEFDQLTNVERLVFSDVTVRTNPMTA